MAMRTDWDAAQYLKFHDERTRPVHELLARVTTAAPRRCVDLGCGPGNSTAVLRERFPDAEVIGVDLSADMLRQARTTLPRVRFEQADLAEWQPPAGCDVMLANAVLQWLPDHERLLSRLAAALAPGGTLAVQMPDNLDEPSHVAMRAVSAREPWAKRSASALVARSRIATPDQYYTWLRRAGCGVDLWRTTYHQVMPNREAMVEWMRGTGLRPHLDALHPDEHDAYLAAYRAALAEAYPLQEDGAVLFAFPRLFIVARREG